VYPYDVLNRKERKKKRIMEKKKIMVLEEWALKEE